MKTLAFLLFPIALLLPLPLTPQTGNEKRTETSIETHAGWSEPVEIYSTTDRRKVQGLFPLGMHARGNQLEVLYMTLRGDRAGKSENAEFTMARSSDGGKTWKYVAAALESPGLINMSKPVFHESFWHVVVQLKGTAPIYAAIHADTGVSEATPIRIEGEPRVGAFTMPTLHMHGGKIYLLMVTGEKAVPANRVYLLESRGGKVWKNIAPESWRHYSFRSGRPILYSSRALLHVLLQEHPDGWQTSHYLRFDEGTRWNRLRVFGHESLTTYPFVGTYNSGKTVIIDGYQWADGTPDYTLRAQLQDGSGKILAAPTVVAPKVLKIWNEWTSLTARNGRFMIMSENRRTSPPGAGLYLIYSPDGSNWRDIAFRPPTDTIQVHGTGTFSKDGQVFHLVYVDVKTKYETGPLRFMYRRRQIR